MSIGTLPSLLSLFSPSSLLISQLLSFSASLPRTSPLLRCLIPSYHLIYYRALGYLAETIMPRPSLHTVYPHAVTVPPATRYCQLPPTNHFTTTPLQLFQPLQYPLQPPSTHPRIQAYLLHAAIPYPHYPADPATYPYIFLHNPHRPLPPSCRSLVPPSLIVVDHRARRAPRPRRLKPCALLAFHS